MESSVSWESGEVQKCKTMSPRGQTTIQKIQRRDKSTKKKEKKRAKDVDTFFFRSQQKRVL